MREPSIESNKLKQTGALAKPSREAAAGKTTLSFFIFGPLIGNVVFGIANVLSWLKSLPPNDGIFLLFLMMFASIFFGVLLCHLFGGIPALVVGFLVGRYGVLFGAPKFWVGPIIVSLLAAPAFFYVPKSDLRNLVVFYFASVVSALFCTLITRKHWRGI
jgi:hypothetical protein